MIVQQASAAAHDGAERPLRVGIFYHADPAAHIPGGIDTIIRGVLKWAPSDIEYTLFGATADPIERPVGRELDLSLGSRSARFVPLIETDPSGARSFVPFTVRYLLALRRYMSGGGLRHLDVLDFHRIEALALFRADARPKSVMIHQDMEVIRRKASDIGWRRAPWAYEKLERRLFRDVDRVFCVRQSAVARYRQTYPELKDRFAFLPTWVDTSVFRPLPSEGERLTQRERVGLQLGLASAAPLLVWVGRLDRQKDPMLLLEAMSKLKELKPGFRLLMIGDGSWRARVEARIRTLELSAHVRVLGSLAPARIAELLQAADLFVLSSAYEGMPIAVLEALATGLPVVTTDVGEVRLVVEDAVNGFVVTERSADALVRRIAEALGRTKALRGRPCEQAVAAYVPERVLRVIYDNHRALAAGKRA